MLEVGPGEGPQLHASRQAGVLLESVVHSVHSTRARLGSRPTPRADLALPGLRRRQLAPHLGGICGLEQVGEVTPEGDLQGEGACRAGVQPGTENNM